LVSVNEVTGDERIIDEIQPSEIVAMGIGSHNIILNTRRGLRIGSVDRKGLRKTVRSKDCDLCGLSANPCIPQEIPDFDSAVPGIPVRVLGSVKQEKFAVVRELKNPLLIHYDSGSRSQTGIIQLITRKDKGIDLDGVRVTISV
jgi:hypothetical protein